MYLIGIDRDQKFFSWKLIWNRIRSRIFQRKDAARQPLAA